VQDGDKSDAIFSQYVPYDLLRKISIGAWKQTHSDLVFARNEYRNIAQTPGYSSGLRVFALEGVANTSNAMKDIPAAEAAYKEVIAINPDRGDLGFEVKYSAVLHLAQIYLDSDRVQEAVTLLRSAVADEVNPSFITRRRLLDMYATALKRVGNDAEAAAATNASKELARYINSRSVYEDAVSNVWWRSFCFEQEDINQPWRLPNNGQTE
ncbi:MAG: tetratricopeptide repeat protein, partial [Terriglobales bacterium]